MASTRTTSTAAFVAGTIAVGIVLVLALWAVHNASVYRQAGRYAMAQAESIAGMVASEAVRVQPPDVRGSGTAPDLVIPTWVWNYLWNYPEYFLLIDSTGTPVHQSAAVSRLGLADSTRLAGELVRLPANAPPGLLSLPATDERLLLVSRNIMESRPGLGRVVVGIGTAGATALPREYLIVIFFLFPLVVGLAGWGAWNLFGKTSSRVEKITSDVSAISDGRSLHRRLSNEGADDEFSDLVATLNAMIARLETSFMGLRRFTADASHELKTPLTVLRADVERAMSETTSPSERMVLLEEALHEVTRMSELVESLLTLARADEGRFDIHKEPVDLKALVQDVYETAQMLGESAGVQVNLPFTADATVMGDPTRLRQLFLNLVTNAIKYTPEGGRVDIGLGLHPDTITFAVRDTGIGIAAADVPHIFERFWRADRARSRTSERGGFGLGLAISQWIAQAHGGTLTASSRLGRGSLFTVTLPIAHSALPARAHEEALINS